MCGNVTFLGGSIGDVRCDIFFWWMVEKRHADDHMGLETLPKQSLEGDEAGGYGTAMPLHHYTLGPFRGGGALWQAYTTVHHGMPTAQR